MVPWIQVSYIKPPYHSNLNWSKTISEPTPLDALAFAYLHCLLHAHNTIRIEVMRRVNLVAWEWRVRCQVINKFTQ